MFPWTACGLDGTAVFLRSHPFSEGCRGEGRPATHPLGFHLCLLPSCVKDSIQPLALNLLSARPRPLVSCSFEARIIERMAQAQRQYKMVAVSRKVVLLPPVSAKSGHANTQEHIGTRKVVAMWRPLRMLS